MYTKEESLKKKQKAHREIPECLWKKLKILPLCLAEDAGDGFADFRGRLHDVDAGGGEGLHLFGGGALSARDDGSGVAHAAARRRGLAGDEADDRLLHVVFDILGGSFFGGTADFADEDDGLGFGVFVE